MLQKGALAGILSLTVLLTVVAWADDKPAEKAVKNQRVNPKLLREAMALPEYKGQAPSAPPPKTVDHVQQLSEKLKAAGDSENAELLQQFIHEHRRLIDQSALTPTSNRDVVELRFDTIDVNMDELPADSILRKIDLSSGKTNSSSEIEKVHKELLHLTVTRNVKLNHAVTIISRFHESARCSSFEDFPISIPGPNAKSETEFREVGSTYEFIATPSTKGRIKLEIICEISAKDKDMQNAITLNGTVIPGVIKCKIQSILDVVPGETNFLEAPSLNKGHKLFILVKATPQQ